MVFVLTFLLRGVFFSLEYKSVDEAVYAIGGRSILQGSVPYRDIVLARTPAIFYVYALIFWVAGVNNMAAVYLFSILWSLATIYFIYRIGEKVFGETVGMYAAVAYTFYSVSNLDFIGFNTEMLMNLPIAAGIFLLVSSKKESIFFWSGFLFSLAVLSKKPAVFTLVAAFVYIILEGFLRGGTRKPIFRRVVYFMAGCVIPAAVILSYLFSVGAFDEFYRWSIVFCYNYGASVPFAESMGKISSYLLPFNRWIPYQIYYAPDISTKIWYLKAVLPNELLSIFTIIAVFYIIKKFVKAGDQRRGEVHKILIVLWLLSSIAGVLSGGRGFIHYHLQAFPPMVLLASYSINILWSKLTKLSEHGSLPLTAAILKFLVAVVIGFALSSLLDFEAKYAIHTTVKFGSPIKLFCPAASILKADLCSGFSHYNNTYYYQPPRRLIEYIKSASTEDEIFVWGCYPEIYMKSGKNPASKYIFPLHAVGDKDSKVRDGRAYHEMLDELYEKRPELIVTSNSPKSFRGYSLAKYPELQKFVRENYAFAKRIENYKVYKRKTII